MKAYLSVFLLIWALPLLAQSLCSGNLGENIFTEGDFGSGQPNVVPIDPGIAPGYQYTTSVPPLDGFYTLTNDSDWPNAFGTWLTIPDNSNDPNGYFMVINASFDPGLFYEQTIDGLCENTLYVFSADVINMIRQGVNDHLEPNVSFLLDGIEQYSTGLIPETNNWVTHGFTFETAPGQTSVTLALRNNAPGGIGNDLGLDNITFRACGPLAQILPETVERICEDGQSTTLEATINGDQYPTPAVQWQRSLDDGQTWIDIPGANDFTVEHTDLSAGFYYYRYLLANSPGNLQNNKCRVVSNVKIVEVVPKRWTVIDTICDGLTFTSGTGATYDVSGVYVDSLISSLGCDSIVTLELAVIPDPGIDADITVLNPSCQGEPGSIAIESIRNGNLPYTYQISSADTLTDGGPLFPGLLPGNYTILVEDRHGCTLREQVSISLPNTFFIDLGPDQTVSLGESVTINIIATNEVARFNWTPAISECDSVCSRVTFLPTESQFYRLDAISDQGCPASDSVRISVVKDRRVYLPNAFSPNNDGINDRFLPLVDEPNVQQILRLEIYDRWGGLIYDQAAITPNDPASGWDGTRNEEAAPNGSYVYRAEVLFLDGATKVYTGDVLLVR